MTSKNAASAAPELQRPPAEVLYTDELERLRAADRDPRPPGWALEPQGRRPSCSATTR